MTCDADVAHAELQLAEESDDDVKEKANVKFAAAKQACLRGGGSEQAEFVKLMKDFQFHSPSCGRGAKRPKYNWVTGSFM